MQSTTLIIVGAGMSSSLGLPTTQQINEVIKILLDFDHASEPRPINERLNEVKDKWTGFDEQALNDLETTLSVLFDGDGAQTIQEAYDSQDKALTEYQREYIECIAGANDAALMHHLSYLTQTYDLIALKSIIYSLKQQSTHEISIVDILTAIQSSIADNISIPTREIFPQEHLETKTIYYCDRKRLDGALNAYKLLVYKIFKHFLRNMKVSDIGLIEKFYYEIVKTRSGLERLDDVLEAFDRSQYLSDIGYLTYNWDPILPFLSMKGNQKLNSELLRESGKGLCKKVYVDFGVPFAGIALSGEHVDIPVYSFSEDAAFLINAFTRDSYTKYSDVKSKLLIKIMKLFVPHGLFNIRICPRCQNGFFIFPENIGDMRIQEVANLFTSDPIPSVTDLEFICSGKYRQVLKKYKEGLPDEIDCPSCEHPVYFNHSFLEIQSIIKNDKPAAINKIQFDYADYFSRAQHIIAIGYSFPKDDIINSVFLKNMKIRKDELGKDCKVTYIGSPDKHYANQVWYGIQQGERPDGDEKYKQTIDVLKSIFRTENIRFNFSGFPDILKHIELNDILDWHL